MKSLNKIFTFLLLIVSTCYFAQHSTPPVPAAPPGGGGGGVGPGSPASPIDMYVYILAITAILFIVLYAKKVIKRQIV